MQQHKYLLCSTVQVATSKNLRHGLECAYVFSIGLDYYYLLVGPDIAAYINGIIY